MTKHKTIQQLLNMSDKDYSEHYFARYLHWCESYALKDENKHAVISDLQKLLANTAINKYYTQLHEDLENQAIEILKPQDGKITIKAAKRIYDSTMVDLFAAFPKPLFDAARKLTLIGQSN